MKVRINMFAEEEEQRFSEAVANLSLEAIEKLNKERKEGTDEHFAFNRAISDTLKGAIMQVTVRCEFSRRTLLTIGGARAKDYLEHEKKRMAYMIGEEIMKAGLLRHIEFDTYDSRVQEVTVGVFQFDPEIRKANRERRPIHLVE